MSAVSTLDSDALASPLVASLNKLITGLSLPFELDTPLDLTPSLLLAVLESLLEERLPVPQAVRESRDQPSKVAAMKIFLGVLEHDIIKQDVGLSDIDPRRLAAGDWEETVFIGELLCWLGKQMGFLRSSHSSSLPNNSPSDKTPAWRPDTQTSGSRVYRSSSSSSPPYDVPRFLTEEDEVGSPALANDDTGSSGDTLHRRHLKGPGSSRRARPMCIHEVEDFSFVGSVSRHSSDDGKHARELLGGEVSYSYCDCDDQSDLTASSTVNSSIKYDGYMEIVNEEAEVQAFKKNRADHLPSRISSQKKHSEATALPTRYTQLPNAQRVLTRHNSPTQHTLALLNERARLLSELASIDLARQG